MTRSRIGINVAANLVGSLGTTAATVALVPMYLHLLGMEAIGLIGINASISVIAGLADFGLAPTLGREMARSWIDPDDMARGRRDAPHADVAGVLAYLRLCHGDGLLLVAGYLVSVRPTRAVT